MPLLVDERLSYFKSLSKDDLTDIWKLYDLYGPTGTKEADMVKQCKSLEIVQFI